MQIDKNSVILYLYDAQLCNPNGDPDEENRPRMDYATQTNLVSDVRLKRYLRDYFHTKGQKLYIPPTFPGEKVLNATERIQEVLGKKKVSEGDIQLILENLIDVRLFGATLPIKGEKEKGGGQSISLTGPVQFSWGYSLHKVYLLETQTITSHFASESDKQQGTMGKDYRLKYSLIAFYGTISKHFAKHTRLSQEDVRLFDQAMLKAIPQYSTRSKVGQTPRLYIRFEFEGDEFPFCDLRPFLEVEGRENLSESEWRSVKDIRLNCQNLIDYIQKKADFVETTYYWKEELLEVSDDLEKHLPNVQPIVWE